MSRRLGALALMALLMAPAQAATLELEGPLSQGGLIIGKVDPGAKVSLDGAPVRVSPDGDFVLGFGREAAPEARLVVRHADGSRSERRLEIAQREYEVQRIDGLPPKQVTPPKEVWERIKAERAMIQEARKRLSAEPWFRQGFAWPATGIVSGVYGSQRILNGTARQPHSGVDVAAPAGTPVSAAAPGTVSLVRQDMYYTGKTVMLDHGHGVSSIYIHMSEILVAEGERVARGQPIGKIGMSGRATGPHLHWGVYLGGVALDPALLVGPMPQPAPEPAAKQDTGSGPQE